MPQSPSAPSSVWDGIRHDVVLLNFGGPTKEAEVQPFLERLFNDPFIIRSPWIGPRLRAFIAKRISTKRAPRVAEEYAKIGYSPINRMTDAQARQLQDRLRARRPDTRVLVVNRYTGPFAEDIVKQLDTRGSRLFLISLYPHLCHSTTVSSIRDFDLAFEAHFGHRDVPSVRVFSWWHNPAALEYSWGKCRESLEAALARSKDEAITVLVSAHGIPQRYNKRGDPYVNEIQAHFHELRRRCELWAAGLPGGLGASSRIQWHLSFQSRVGPVDWVRPYTDEAIAELGPEHKGTLLMVPISFTADHIETLFEMDHTYRDLALRSGFSHYARVAPANDDPAFTDCLVDVLVQHGF
jgi:ferrochelatase